MPTASSARRRSSGLGHSDFDSPDVLARPRRSDAGALATPTPASSRQPLRSTAPNGGPPAAPVRAADARKRAAMPAPRKSAARKSEDAAPPRRAAAGAARRVVDSDSDDELAGGDDAYGEEDEGDTTIQSAPRRKAAAAPTPVETSSRTQMVPLQTKPRLPGGGVSALARSRMASSGAGTAGFARRGAPSSSDAAPHPSSSSAFTDTSTRSRGGVAALARANGPRRSLGASLHVQAGNASASHEAQAKEVQKLNVDSTSFEEWMKMATDNKINASNTWNFALIDYFHDMSLLRSESGDGSINFQKASCTLDGCIKVWTSRVDSVVVETGKLLSGLQDDLDLRTSKKGKEAEDEEDGEEDEEGNTKSKKRKGKAREATLAKNFSQLAIKKLDVEFSVDPLFKKTSADFDEGGAGGLLMNHLGVDGKARIVFDASDVAGVADEGDEQDALPADGDADREATPLASAQQDHEMVDLTKLRVTLFGHDEVAFSGSENALSALLSQRTICPTFASFRFAPDDTTPFSALSFEHAPGNDGYSDPAYDDSMGGMPAFDDMPEGDEGEDFFGAGNDYAGGDDGDDIFAAPLDVRQGSHDADDDDELAAIAHDQPRGSAAAPSQRDLALAFVGVGAAQDEEAEGGADGMFDYFDQHLVKNWAGPEHWKMRKGVGAMPGAKGADADGPSGSSAPKAAPRKSKEAFVIDFTTPAGAMSSAELFAPAKGGVGIMLPRNKGAADLHLLPEDRHFSSRELLRLAIKPRAVLNLRRRGARVAQTNDVDMAHPADVDEEFWAQAAAEREQGVGGAYDEHEAQPFNTEFFHDADDDGAFDMLEDGGPSGFGDEGEEEELPTQAIRRIRPEYVNYAKRAKRVDVKRLKDSIWKELAIDVDALSDEEDDEPSTPGRTKPEPGSSGPRTFSAVISGLKKSYAKEKLDEISTSYCFICLLHLANEEGLDIRIDDAAPSSSQKRVAKNEAPLDKELGEENMEGIFRRLAASAAQGVLDDEDAGGEEGDGDGGLRVGRLENLVIVNDRNAGRGA